MAAVAEFLIKKAAFRAYLPEIFLRQTAQKHPTLRAVMSLYLPLDAANNNRPIRMHEQFGARLEDCALACNGEC